MHRTGLTGTTSGDVVDVVPDCAGGAWLIVADVCGADAEATRVARDVQLVGRATAGVASKPAVVLAQMDLVLRESSLTDRFVTAAVAHLQPAGSSWLLELALAGHPLPLLVHDGRVLELGGPGLPLNLGVGGACVPQESQSVLRPGDVVLMWTDGVTDRQRRNVEDAEVSAALTAATTTGVLAADQLTHFLTALTDLAGPSRDDLAALLVTIP
jgi:serine phosphatase RsbU (regulator of sigma subunit)